MQGRIFAKREVFWYTSIRDKHCLKRPATQATGTGRNHDDEMMYYGLRRIHVYLSYLMRAIRGRRSGTLKRRTVDSD